MYTHTSISVELLLLGTKIGRVLLLGTKIGRVLLLGTKIGWVLLLGTFFFRTITNDIS
jgi:hypothetical protein